ncbi:acylphosphatase [Corynebacterium sp. HMSC077D10]|uniref:acylphosphatase n=1 Tax=Corynebacterium TaxID=1716 RepID=UPI0007976A32|nr:MULTISPECIES: acylphosphatase [unclassified Corynebacterium]KXB56023.1 acylphosphatase [Corynebacterium sp. DNF00584]OFL78767.1 acylphosphatase [Corynebacterium sp. HMSC077B05]OFN39456.1 acylphosphatase [Corynebacterium sp. HMSC072G08]OFP21004.1 acylphosphatase [Corynebacterium sp. HMSC065A05]OFP69411.1 acylphosphatase [Corynebacterium sp. HMSC077D10]
MVRMTAFVHGYVQGVGFRWWVRSRALELGLVGHATNLSDGRVQIVAEGPREVCERLLELTREQPSTTRRPGTVDTVVPQWAEPKGESGFIER